MKKMLNKYVLIIFLLLIAFNLLSICHETYAVDFSLADEFIKKGSESTEGGLDKAALEEIGGEFTAIGAILTYIGAGILVGAMGYMGILYLVSPPEKQAKLKVQLIGLVVSAIVIFGAYYIWEIIVNLLDTATAVK